MPRSGARWPWAPHRADGRVHLGEHASRMNEEDRPRGEQLDPARRAREEARAELVLQAADLPGEGRLGDVQATRGAPHVLLIGDGDEVPDLREAHGVEPTTQRGATNAAHPIPRGYWTRSPPHRRLAPMAIEIFGPRHHPALLRAGRAAAATLAEVAARLQPGVSTADIDRWVREDTARRGGTPSQLGYKGFPAAVCTSKNHVVCHGIPRPGEQLAPGDIVNVDVTTYLDGFHGDTSATFCIGEPGPEARRLVEVARRCRDAGVAVVREGARLGDIGAAIEELARGEGCSVVRELGGHGIGRRMHAPPHVAHFGARGTGLRLRAGMCFTIEPMINLGGPEVRFLDDGWTVVTADGSLSAQFEHTVLVTREGCQVLTAQGEIGVTEAREHASSI